MRLVVHPAAQLELDAALARSRLEFGLGTAASLLRRFDRAGNTLIRPRLLERRPRKARESCRGVDSRTRWCTGSRAR